MEPARIHTAARLTIRGSSEIFRNTPLLKPETQIRLLELEPGSGDEDIMCNLRVYDRDDLPSYDAISYTWGEEWPIRTISVNGALFDVRQNCWYALKQVRFNTSKRLLWIDTICINQNDTVEKGHQVQRIASTFKGAETVLASLGSDLSNDGDCGFLFQWAARAVESSEMNHDEFSELFPEVWTAIKANHPSKHWSLPASRASWNHKILSQYYWMQCLSLPGLERLVKAYHDFSSRRYWKRVWIHPELAMASNILIHSGSDTLTMKALKELIQYLYFLKSDQGTFEALYPTVSELLWSFLHLSLDPIVQALHRINPDRRSRSAEGFCGISFRLLKDIKCSDPRDRVFAFLPLMRKEEPSLKVDYTKSKINLAFQLLDFCKNTLDIRWALEGLRLNRWGREKDIAAFLYSRTKLHAEHADSNESFQRGLCFGCDFPRGRLAQPSSDQICQVQSNSDGTLTLNHVSRNQTNPRLHHANSTFYPGVHPGHLPKRHHIIRSRSTDYSSEEVIGLLPGKARNGDVLVRSRGHRNELRYESLVLRKHDTKHNVEIYEIIGQALVRPDYDIEGVTFGMNLFIRDEDLMAFALEDFSNTSIDPGMPRFSQDRRIEVPFTTTRFSSFAVSFPASVSDSEDDYPWRLSYCYKCLTELLFAPHGLASSEEPSHFHGPIKVDKLTAARLMKSKEITF